MCQCLTISLWSSVSTIRRMVNIKLKKPSIWLLSRLEKFSINFHRVGKALTLNTVNSSKQQKRISLLTQVCTQFFSFMHSYLQYFQSYFLTDEILNNRTLFADIIHCIENVIQTPKKMMTPKKALLQDSFNDSLNDSLGMFQNFQQWEKKHSQKFSVIK